MKYQKNCAKCESYPKQLYLSRPIANYFEYRKAGGRDRTMEVGTGYGIFLIR